MNHIGNRINAKVTSPMLSLLASLEGTTICLEMAFSIHTNGFATMYKDKRSYYPPFPLQFPPQRAPVSQVGCGDGQVTVPWGGGRGCASFRIIHHG